MKTRKKSSVDDHDALVYSDAIILLSIIQKISHQLFSARNIADINTIIAAEFKDIDQFNATILILNREKTHLQIAATTGRHTRFMAAMKKTLGISPEGISIDLNKAEDFNRVVKTGRTTHLPVWQTLMQFLPGPVLKFVETISTGTRDRETILSPLKTKGETIGILSITCPPEVSLFLPLIENFVMHLSLALENITEKEGRQKAETEREKNLDMVKQINALAVELAAFPADGNIFPLVCERLRTITGAVITAISVFNEAESKLSVSHVSAEKEVLETLQRNYNHLLPNSIPVSRELYHQMFLQPVIQVPHLFDLSFGALRHDISDSFEAGLDIRSSYGISFNYGDELYGSAAVFLHETAQDLTKDVLQIFSNIVSATLKRVRDEAVLRTSEQKYRTIFESLRDVYYKVNSEGVVVDISPSIVRGGYTPGEIIGRKFSEFYAHPQERSQFLQAIYAKGEVTDYEIRFRAKNGSLLFLSVDAHVIFSDDGRPVAIEGMLHDITQRKQIEEALIRSRQELEIRVAERTEDLYQANEQLKTELGRRKRVEAVLQESEAKFRRLVQQSKDAIFLVSKDGEVIYASPACETIFGHSAEEFLADNDLADKLVHPDFRDAYAALWANFRDHQVFPDTPVEVPFIHRDGRLVYTENNVTGIFDDTGAIIGIQIIIRDITQRLRAEQELKASEEKFRNLAEQSPNMIFINAMGPLAYVNQQCVDIMGYSREEFYSPEFKFLDLVAPEFRDITRMRFGQQMQGVNVTPYEYVILTKSGGRIDALLSTRVISYGQGRAVLGVITDISNRKKVEHDLLQAKELLERQNNELKKIDRIKDGLIRDVAHELKTPVAKQAMQIELLKEICVHCKEHATGENIVKVLEEAVQRQEKVIRNILDLSRLEAGGRKYRIEPMRLDNILNEVLMYYGGTIAKYNGATTVSLTETTIHSDDEMLFHVFSNIINNAIKYRDRLRPLAIGVSMEKAAARVVVKIRDNGIGLEGDEPLLAFESFYQASPSSEGSGVGLSICKRIMEDLGGSIRLESEGKGKGTTAVVELPAGEV